MHLGNILAAMLSWHSAKSRGGRWILRIEDLDPDRSKYELARLIEDDLGWLGLDWDEGGLDDRGSHGPYSQSRRGEIYGEYLAKLGDTGLLYGCRCRRADIMAANAPHQCDGRIVYPGTCRPAATPPFPAGLPESGAIRIFVPDEEIVFTDATYGRFSVNLARHCGDFILRRADGAWAYQLAVVVDDALMGVSEVVRGSDLLLSSAQQIYLCRLLGLTPPDYRHIPLLCNPEGRRLSKRDASLSMAALRDRYSPEEILGRLAFIAGLKDDAAPASADELLALPFRIKTSKEITLSFDELQTL